MAHRSQLEGRLIAILDPKVPRAAVSPLRTALTAVGVACALAPLAAMQPWTVGAPEHDPSLVPSSKRSVTLPLLMFRLPSRRPSLHRGRNRDPSPATRTEAAAPLATEIAQAVSDSVTQEATARAQAAVQGAVQGVIQAGAQGAWQDVAQAAWQGVAQGAVQGAVQGAIPAQP